MLKVVKQIKNKHLLTRIACLLIGTFVITLFYNKFLVPNHIVVGGISGLAIVIEEMFDTDTTLFINISNITLIILSFLIIGKRKTIDQLIGCIAYIIMLNITAPLAKLINFSFSSDMLLIIFVSLFWGFFNGLIYRAGYSTGGSDFLAQILSIKIKKSITQISLVIQVVVILLSALVFPINYVLLSIFVIYVSNKITNAVLFGVSTKKMVYVVSKNINKIEDFLLKEMNTGVTEMKVESGTLTEKKEMIMCVIHNAQYDKFKENILKIDPKAFLMSNNCYEVKGGMKYNILPF